MKYTTHIYDSAALSAIAVADLIVEKAKVQQQNSKFFNIAVSGGSTPKYLFSLLAEETFQSHIPWELVRFFWVDERCVDPNDSESNYKMTYKALLHHDFILPENVFRMKGEDTPENEALRYGALLKAELPMKNGFPVFDFILLGLGDDGHTASIFPDNLSLLTSDKAVAVTTHPVSGQQRITLTGKTINNAEEVVFLVNGKNKAAIVATIINQTAEAKQYPASHVHNAVGKCLFYLDKDAAGTEND